MGFLAVMVILAVMLVIAGSVAGLVALARIARLEAELFRISERSSGALPTEPASVPPAVPTVSTTGPRPAPPPTPRPPGLATTRPTPAAGPRIDDWRSFEMLLGTRWLARGGMVMFLIGLALLLRFTYDHALIGPTGRLALGALAGAAALAGGEYARRRHYPVLFQTLTGGGLGIFYICIYFSFAVYDLSGASLAMALAVLVTGAAVVLAVGHNAMPIAMLGLLGGYASPLLLGDGGNQPWLLFSYVQILNLVALGVAWFRRWPPVQLLALLGSATLFFAWYLAHYDAAGMTPALLFITLFYLTFLLVPTLHSLVSRTPQEVSGLMLLAGNSLVWLVGYYLVLFDDASRVLGFVVITQAALMLGLHQLHRRQLPQDEMAARGLLAITLALVTLAIPLQLELYGITIAWAMEGALFAWLGLRYRSNLTCIAAVAALLLAAGGLIAQLPLHNAPFTPVFNVPFGSWLLVIAATAASAWLLDRAAHATLEPQGLPTIGRLRLPELTALLAYLLGCAVLTMEVWSYWQAHRHGLAHRDSFTLDSLIVLWSFIPLLTATALARFGRPRLAPLAWSGYGVCALLFLFGTGVYSGDGTLFGASVSFWARLVFPAALLAGISLLDNGPRGRLVMEVTAQAALAILLALECLRWADATELMSYSMGFGIVSALWALHGVTLVWLGLTRHSRPRRMIGFALLGLAVAKTLLIDTSQLAEVYRIVSYLASGLLLLLGGYFYQRYSRHPEPEESSADAKPARAP